MGLLSAGDAGAAPSSLVRFSSSASLHRSSKLASRSSVVWKASKMPKRGSPASEVYSHVTADFSFPLRRYVLKETLDMPPCLYHSITLARMMARLSALSDVAIIERSFGWQSLSCAAMRDTAASSSAPDISPAAMRLSSGSTSSLFCSAMLSRQLVLRRGEVGKAAQQLEDVRVHVRKIAEEVEYIEDERDFTLELLV
eukprot:scaffold138644_cov26-Tisochrysis_lutea.AAC.2